MASPLYVAQNGTYEEFLEVYDPETSDVTEMLCAGLINRDPEAVSYTHLTLPTKA